MKTISETSCASYMSSLSDTQRACGCMTVQPLQTKKIPWPLQIMSCSHCFYLSNFSFHFFSLSLVLLLALSLPPWLSLCYELIRWDFGSMIRASSEEQLHKLNPIVLKYEHLGSEIGSAHNDSGWEWLFCLLSSEKNQQELNIDTMSSWSTCMMIVKTTVIFFS